MGNAPIYLPRRVLAHHLILTGYGHWLPNDIRGSGSDTVRNEQLRELGVIHLGRKLNQPSRTELKEFFREANAKLQFEPLWFDTEMRGAIAKAFESVVANKYTVWACAICQNHSHLVIRAHRDNWETIGSLLMDASRKALRGLTDDSDHPIWSRRAYSVFKFDDKQVVSAIRYVENNPMKSRLASQSWNFVAHRKTAGNK